MGTRRHRRTERAGGTRAKAGHWGRPHREGALRCPTTLSRSNGITSHTPLHGCHTSVLHTYCVAGIYTQIRDCHISRVNGYTSSAQCDCQPWLDGLSRRPLVSPSPCLGFIVRRRIKLVGIAPTLNLILGADFVIKGLVNKKNFSRSIL
jgi:hypothetical protein